MEGIGKAIGTMITVVTVLLFVSIPLAIWKLVEIAFWLWDHVKVSLR